MPGLAGLRIGATFPMDRIGTDPVAIRDWAQAAEELGFDYIETFDHVLGAVHADREPELPAVLYDETDAFHEPLVLFGYLAAVTSRIELATGILILPQRQAALVAKQAAQVQILSAGRFRMAVGSGWNWVEYEALGVPWARRGARMEEQVDVIRRLLREPVVDFHGEFHDIPRAGIEPRPATEVPIWFGGAAPVAIDRAARIGDGYFAPGVGDDRHAELALLQERLEAAGRPVEGFPVQGALDYAHGPDAWIPEAERWAAAGGTHFSMRAVDSVVDLYGLEPLGFTTVDDHIGALQRFAEALR